MDLFQFFPYSIIINAAFFKELGNDIILITKYGKQQMLSTDQFAVEHLCFQVSDLQCPFSLSHQGKVLSMAACLLQGLPRPFQSFS